LASRSNTRFQKRLKELARANKRRDKEEKKLQRKAERVSNGGGPPIEAIAPAVLALPPLEDETVAEGSATPAGRLTAGKRRADVRLGRFWHLDLCRDQGEPFV